MAIIIVVKSLIIIKIKEVDSKTNIRINYTRIKLKDKDKAQHKSPCIFQVKNNKKKG